MESSGGLGSILRAVAVAAAVALFVFSGLLDRPRSTGRTMHSPASLHTKHVKLALVGKRHVRPAVLFKATGWSRREAAHDLRHPERPSPLAGQLTNLENQVGLHPEKVVRALAP